MIGGVSNLLSNFGNALSLGCDVCGWYICAIYFVLLASHFYLVMGIFYILVKILSLNIKMF